MLHCTVPALDLGKRGESPLIPAQPKGQDTISSGERRESVGITSGKILDACRERASITIPDLASKIGVTERSIQRNIQKLQDLGFLKRVGGRKEGHWEVLKN